MEQISFKWIVILFFLFLSACSKPPLYNIGISQIIWSPDQNSLIFGYYFQDKFPRSSPVLPSDPANLIENIQRIKYYRVKTDGSKLEEFLDPVTALRKEDVKNLIVSILGWSDKKLILFTHDGLYAPNTYGSIYAFNPETKQLSMFSQKEDFLPTDACMAGKWLIISDFPKDITRYASSIAPLNNISSTRIIEIEKKNTLSDYPVSFLNCSPDGKHIYYEKKDPKSAEVVERGIAALNPELATLENPVALPLKKDSEHSIIGWLEPSALLYLYSSESPINKQNGAGVESYLFSYPSGENKIHPNFLEKPRLFDMSPDFKQVAYVSDGKIQISDINGNNVRDILDFSKLLPKGEPFISDY